MISIIKGDIIDVAIREAAYNDESVIAHGCNCFQTMNSGVAKAIRSNFPEAYEADLAFGTRGDKSKLGKYSVGMSRDPFGTSVTVFNLYTQYRYGTDAVHINWEAFREAIELVGSKHKIETLYIPAIGTGLAGGTMDDLINNLIDIDLGRIENLTLVINK